MNIAEGGLKKYTEKATVKSSVMFALAAKCDAELAVTQHRSVKVSCQPHGKAGTSTFQSLKY